MLADNKAFIDDDELQDELEEADSKFPKIPTATTAVTARRSETFIMEEQLKDKDPNAPEIPGDFMRIIQICVFFSLSVTVALVLSIYLLPEQGYFSGGVSTSDSICSEMSVKILKSGGSAVDASISAVLCESVLHPDSTGLGGGGVMIVRDQKNNLTTVVDFTPVKWVGEISLPTLLSGLDTAHRKFGKLSWKDVVQPVIDLIDEGYLGANPVSSVRSNYTSLLTQPLANQNNDGPIKVVPPVQSSRVLKEIGSKGSGAFYSGQLLKETLDAIGAVTIDFDRTSTAKMIEDYKPNTTVGPERFYFQGMLVETPANPGGEKLFHTLRFLDSWIIDGGDNGGRGEKNLSTLANVFASYDSSGDFFRDFFAAYSGAVRRPKSGNVTAHVTKDVPGGNNDNNNNRTTTDDSIGRSMVNGESSHVLSSNVVVIGPNDMLVAVTTSLGYKYGSKVTSTINDVILGTYRFQPNIYLPTLVRDPLKPCSKRYALAASSLKGLTEVIILLLSTTTSDLETTLAQLVEKPRKSTSSGNSNNNNNNNNSFAGGNLNNSSFDRTEDQSLFGSKQQQERTGLNFDLHPVVHDDDEEDQTYKGEKSYGYDDDGGDWLNAIMKDRETVKACGSSRGHLVAVDKGGRC